MSSLRKELDKIREEHGYIDPNVVVEVATSKTHPLHNRFEWNDKIAGAAYRRDQAHELIQSVRCKYTGSDGRPKSVRQYLAVDRPDSPQPVYEPVGEVMQDEFTRTLVLSQMDREWRTLQGRYGDMVEFAEMVKASLAA